jgi:hypothetical protein
MNHQRPGPLFDAIVGSNSSEGRNIRQRIGDLEGSENKRMGRR